MAIAEVSLIFSVFVRAYGGSPFAIINKTPHPSIGAIFPKGPRFCTMDPPAPTPPPSQIVESSTLMFSNVFVLNFVQAYAMLSRALFLLGTFLKCGAAADLFFFGETHLFAEVPCFDVKKTFLSRCVGAAGYLNICFLNVC